MTDSALNVEMADVDEPLYMVTVYYRRSPEEELRAREDGMPGCELYGAVRSEVSACAIALRASQQNAHDYVVEGGRYEPGACDGPVYREGVRRR